ncbi:hypothetical protein NE237_017216 [Protea cynaroides]|uniref:NB-ARC domain-containing protein n=1 Tax=Protea cynaroides TaxID=273540 RepID=A0A9Q0QMN4_9MAGN|nr:hypothetical protein NE237_017216 [Protea cynaroides]
MADTEITHFINRMGYTLLTELDSFHKVEDQLWSLLCLLMRLRFVLMEVERKQSEDLEKFIMEVVTLVHEAEKVTVSYLDTTRKSGLVMVEADKFRSKISRFKSQIKGMMESNAWFPRFTESNTSNTSSLSKRPLSPPIEDGNAVVVLEDEVKRMINLLKDEDQDGQRDIIPVVGPKGMGKTTFVWKIYNDPIIVEHFPCRSWINVSSDYKIEELLQDIKEKIKPATTPIAVAIDNTKDGDWRKKMKNLKDLAIETYKHLKDSTRYLIVFDDVSKAQFWADINPVFPAKKKRGSRIILITCHDEVASHARSSRPPFYLQRLSKDEGRTLFSKRVTSLVDSHSHTQLDLNHYRTYHELVDARGGLPLAIVSLATEYHRRLLSAIDNGRDEESGLDKRLPLEICECIYNGLPCHLKMCLAYYHVLKEGYGFFDYKGLIIVEGLVKLPPPRVKIQSGDQASSSTAATTVVVEMEDIAEEHLNELINMNLIKVQRRSFDGRIKEITIPQQYYSLLDLFRSEATSSKMNKLEASSLFINYLSGSEEEKTMLPNMELIFEDVLPRRVLYLMHVALYNNPRIINLIHLRYLRLEIDSYPSDFTLSWLSNLCNLQFVKIKLPYTGFRFQVEFWKMRQLRHFLLRGLPLYPSSSLDNRYNRFFWDLVYSPSVIIEKEVNGSNQCRISLKNLRTLEGLDLQYCREDVLSMMPNLVKLHLRGEIPKFDDQLARVFPLLERLQKLHVDGLSNLPHCEMSNLKIFPPNITHLSLVCTFCKGKHLVRALQKLQNLRTLKLGLGSINPNDDNDDILDFGSDVDGFRQLKFLELKMLHKVELVMSASVMPSLQKLAIISCAYLKGLPLVALEAIPTLQELELRGSHLKDQVLRDARLIEEHVGKDRLKLSISLMKVTGKTNIIPSFLTMGLHCIIF